MREIGLCPICGKKLKKIANQTYAYAYQKGTLYISLEYDSCPKCGADRDFFEKEKEDLERFLKEREENDYADNK